VTVTVALDPTDTSLTARDAPVVDAGAELDRQLHRLIDLGYGELTGLGDAGLRDAVESLRSTAVARTSAMPAPASSAVPFVVVLAPRLSRRPAPCR